jgi:hypothetical protein
VRETNTAPDGAKSKSERLMHTVRHLDAIGEVVWQPGETGVIGLVINRKEVKIKLPKI